MQVELRGCETCKGRKTMMGLGSIRQDCETCKGTGSIDQFIKIEKLEDLNIKDTFITVDKAIDEPVKASDADVVVELEKKFDVKKKKQKEG